jgi:hypothetical protein
VNDVIVLGTHNRAFFPTMFDLINPVGVQERLKTHILVANYVVKTSSVTVQTTITCNGEQIQCPGAGGGIICKPSLIDGLIINGKWKGENDNIWSVLDENDIKIDPNRQNTLQIKIDLSSNNNPPRDDQFPIRISFEIQTVKVIQGQSIGDGQIITTFNPEDRKNERKFNLNIAHELGHVWKQTYKLEGRQDSLNTHPKFYVGHGGKGHHCRYGVRSYINNGLPIPPLPEPQARWETEAEIFPTPKDGKCIMFHQMNDYKLAHFCDICKPYLQLLDMKQF